MPLKRLDVNWVDVETDFVEGFYKPGATEEEEATYIQKPTLQDLCERHDVSYSAVSKRSAAEKWAHKRKVHWTRIERQRLSKKLEEFEMEAVKFNINTLNAARQGVQNILVHFGMARQVQEKTGEPMNQYKLDALSRALERYQKVGRLSLGQSTENGQQIILKEEHISLGDFSGQELDMLEKLAEGVAKRMLSEGDDE